MKKRSHLFAFVMCLVMSMCMFSVPASASTSSGTKSTAGVSASELTAVKSSTTEGMMSAQRRINFNYLRLNYPKMGSTVRKGNRIYISFRVTDTYKYYYTRPIMYIYNSKGRCVYSSYLISGRVPVDNRYHTYTGYCGLNTRNLARGKYKFVIYAAPCYSNLRLVSGWSNWNTLMYDYNYFYIK